MDMVILKRQGKLLDLIYANITEIYVAESLDLAFFIPNGFSVPD
jgi:hypothetical protein